ncbi:MAG: acetamidase/formamidase family protein, partial [Microvirga sp.]
MAEVRIDAGPDTVHWGFFDAALPPIATVASGTTVILSSVSGGPEVMPGPPHAVPPTLAAIHAVHTPRVPGHLCTGPVAIEGARAGDVLEVRIRQIDLLYDWGFNVSAPQKGALPDDFDAVHLMHIALDPETMTGRLPWGLDLP